MVANQWVGDFLKAHLRKSSPPKIYKKGWNKERAAAARQRIYEIKPWECSTGPTTKEGKEKTKFNSLKHGKRSKTMRFISMVCEEVKNME